MSEQPVKDKAAIVGIGWSEFVRRSDTPVATLATKACLMAIDDAGLKVEDIDGVISFYHGGKDTISPRELAEMIGMPRCNFNIFQDGGGSWSAASVLSAAMLVASGVCKTVLVYRAKVAPSRKHSPRPDGPRYVLGERAKGPGVKLASGILSASVGRIYV